MCKSGHVTSTTRNLSDLHVCVSADDVTLQRRPIRDCLNGFLGNMEGRSTRSLRRGKSCCAPELSPAPSVQRNTGLKHTDTHTHTHRHTQTHTPSINQSSIDQLDIGVGNCGVCLFSNLWVVHTFTESVPSPRLMTKGYKTSAPSIKCKANV